jgi:uncharacterized protein (TIGR01244 family)
MDIRQITPRYSVSPQIAPEDLAAIVAAGFTRVICNRPDGEVPATLQSSELSRAAAAAGIEFFILPLTHQTMDSGNIARQRAFIDGTDGPVLAYCASGTRCAVIWALSQAGNMPSDAILGATSAAGYALDQLRPLLDKLAQDNG